MSLYPTMDFMHKEWKAGFHVPELEVAAKRLFFTKVSIYIYFFVNYNL